MIMPPGTYRTTDTVVLDASHPLSAIRDICFYGGRYAYASGKDGFFINRGRETLLSNVNLSNGSNLGTSVKTTNSLSVLITRGRDDAAPMILDSKTVRIPTNAADGGFYDIEGKLRIRMGTGAGKALVGGVTCLNGSSKGTTAVTTEETLMSYTLPADSLSSDGKGLRIIAWRTTAYNTNKKTIRIKFGETVVMTNRVVTEPANLDWRLEAIIIGRMISIKGIGSGTLGY